MPPDPRAGGVGIHELLREGLRADAREHGDTPANGVEEIGDGRTRCDAPGFVAVDPPEVLRPAAGDLPAHRNRREIEPFQAARQLARLALVEDVGLVAEAL